MAPFLSRHSVRCIEQPDATTQRSFIGEQAFIDRRDDIFGLEAKTLFGIRLDGLVRNEPGQCGEDE
ncbi:MAG: hypothetical protein C1943_17080 [Halochromatium sp.]|nr:hypothetical protein [Halochromatium sp.]